MQSNPKQKVIFDTDIGSDIDDSYALCYLLNNKDCDLIGITTVTGQAKERGVLCSNLCKIANRNIPIYVGENKPIGNQEELQPICHMAKIGNDYPSYPLETKRAYEYLVDVVNEFMGEITLISVAPFSNVAKAIKLDHDFGRKLKRLVIMGGKEKQSKDLEKVLDWNMLCDREASRIMLEAEYKEFIVFPCDLTNKVFTPSSYLKENIKGKYADIMNSMGDNWFNRDHQVFHYHDPMACVYCFREDLFKLKKGNMTFIQDDKGAYTDFKECEDGKLSLAYEIDKEAFLAHLYEVINYE